MYICIYVYMYICIYTYISIYCFYPGQRQSQPSALINYLSILSLIVHFNDNYYNRKWLLALLDMFALSNKSNVHIYYVNLSNCVCKVMNSW